MVACVETAADEPDPTWAPSEWTGGYDDVGDRPDAGDDTDTETETESDTESQSETESQTETETETEPESETESQSETQTESQSETESKTETETESEAEFGGYPGSTPSPETGCDEHKTLICHLPPGDPGQPLNLCVATASLPAHQDHGDLIGRCP